MNEKVSIFLAGIRPENWTRLYQSVAYSTLREFEIIFVGPKPPSDDLLNNANVKFIQDFGCSSRCYHIGLLASSYDFVTWAADDGWFLENRSIDKAFDKLLSMGPSHKNVVSFKYFEGGWHDERKGDAFWKFGYHYPGKKKIPYVPNNYQLLMNGLMYKDYLIELGGWDCRLEAHGMSTCDLAVRVQNDGGVIHMLDEPFMFVTHFCGTTGDHAPVHYAHIEHDEPFFAQLYSDPASQYRTKIDINNWKDAPDIWIRRFGSDNPVI